MGFGAGLFVCTLPVLKKFVKHWDDDEVPFTRAESREWRGFHPPYDSCKFFSRWAELFTKRKKFLPDEMREPVTTLHEYVLWFCLSKKKGVNDCKIKKCDFALNPQRCNALWKSIEKIKPKEVAAALFEPTKEPDYLDSQEELEVLLTVYWKAVKNAAERKRWLVGVTFI